MKKIMLIVMLMVVAVMFSGCVVITRAQLRDSPNPEDRALAEELTKYAEQFRHDANRDRQR